MADVSPNFASPFDPNVGQFVGGLIPDFAADAYKRRVVAVQEGQLALAMRQQQQEEDEESSFLTDFQGLGADPSPGNVARIIARHPKRIEGITKYYDGLTEERRIAEQTRLGGIYEAARTGHWDLAIQKVQEHIDADKAAGRPIDPLDQAYLEDMQSGDTDRRNTALGGIAYLTAAADPKKFNETYKTLSGSDALRNVGPDDVVIRTGPSGKPEVVYSSTLHKTAEGGLTEDIGGPGPTAPAGAPTAAAPGGDAGADAAIEHSLGNEGGYNPKDMNGAPVNFGINEKENAEELRRLGLPGVKDLTREQAKDIYRHKYWPMSGAAALSPNMQAPYFDVFIRNPAAAKAMLRDANGDPAKFMASASTFFQRLGQTDKGRDYAKSWANRDAKNTAIATGQAPPGATPATTPEAAAPAAPPEGALPAGPGQLWRTAPKGYTLSDDRKYALPIGGPAALTPEAIDDGVEQYLAGVPLNQIIPGLGKDAGANRVKIMNQAAKRANAEGLSPGDRALQMAFYKNQVASLRALQQQALLVGNNEDAALANLDAYIQVSRKIQGQSDYPRFNSISQWAQRHTGNPLVRALNVARMTAATEYAKVIGGSPSGAGVLSDSARHEALDMLDNADNLAAKLAIQKQMITDMGNRKAAFTKNIEEGYKHLGERAPGLPPVHRAGAPPGYHYGGMYKGKRVIVNDKNPKDRRVED